MLAVALVGAETEQRPIFTLNTLDNTRDEEEEGTEIMGKAAHRLVFNT